MDIESAIKKAIHTLKIIRTQERTTLRAVARFGKEVEDKARQSFRRSIAKSEAELGKVLEERKKRTDRPTRKV